MADSAVAKKSKASPASRALATATAEVVTNAARNVSGELVSGQRPLREVARVVAAGAFEDIEKRGPSLAKDAGIMSWRYAALGWVTWQVGKRVIRRKAKKALSSSTKED